ncbi:MAG: hypothetical protein EBQ99_07565 [Planctomycetes bacterium]|nr:hypothetical protein [Planctomycetota bacterium]
MFRLILPSLLALVPVALAAPPSPMQADQKDPSKPPKVYVVPLGLDGKGQMGADIHSSIYEKVVKDIQDKKPDLLVLSLDSAERGRREYSGAERDSLGERGVNNSEDLRKLLALFKKDVGDVPQVMWVQDSVGFGTLLAFAWPNMYTKSDARLGGLAKVSLQAKSNDREVERKWLAAAMSIANGCLESGGHPTVIGTAMMDPERMLSVSFKGRKFDWTGDRNGTFLIDGDPSRVANFDARTAEDFGLSDGTADSLDDVMFMLGYRAYDDTLVKGGQDGTKIVGDYIAAWRKAWEDSQASFGEYERMASSGDPKELVKARKALEAVQGAMERFPAVELRWRMKGLSKPQVEGLLKQLKEKAKPAKGGSRGGGGGMGR